MSFDLDSFFNGHVPEAAMIAAALVAFLVIYTYRQDDEGDACKASVLLGLIVGVLLLLICLERTDNWNYIDKILVYLLQFSLIIRPFKDLNIALVIQLLVAAGVYMFLGGIDVDVVNSGWGRIIITVVVMVFVYGLLHLVQSLVQIVGKIFNWYPILAQLSIVVLADGALMISGQDSIGLLISSKS